VGKETKGTTSTNNMGGKIVSDDSFLMVLFLGKMDKK